MIENKKVILLLILTIKLTQSIQEAEFCYKISINNEVIKCEENKKYNYDCSEGLCSVDRFSCQSLTLFSTVRKYSRNDYMYFKNKFESFMNEIKECPEPAKYEWNPNDVCLNKKNCLNTFNHRLWLWTNHKMSESKCKGKYNIRCNSDYCASDKRACENLKKDFMIQKC